MRKKTEKQRQNTNVKSGKAKNKKKTVSKELLMMLKKPDNKISEDSKYPSILITKDPKLKADHDTAKYFYDTLFLSSKYLTFFLQEIDKIQLAYIALNLVVYDKLMKISMAEIMIEETNGNTGEKVQRVNPATLEANKLERIILAQMDRMGLTPMSRVDLMNKMSGLDSDDLVDNKTLESNEQGTSLQGFQKLANTNKKSN